MNPEARLDALNHLLALIYGPGTQLSSLLHELGFEQAQVDRLQGEALQAVVSGLLDSLHKRLTSDSGRDTYFELLSRRYGLDGETPSTVDQLAQERGLERQFLAQLLTDILARCKTQSAQNDLRKSLKQLAVAQLSRSAGRPTRETVAAKLERLSNLRSAADVTQLDYDAKRLEILKKVQSELDALELEYGPIIDSVQENISDLENEIRTDVLLHGETVSGGTYRAIYTRGRISWDNQGMEKFAERHPEVLQFRRQGAPVVTLRAIAEKD
jgi:hypothetical protein